MNESQTAIVTATAVTRIFGSGESAVVACSNIDLEVRAGELLVVRGPSGSGKTTLVNLLGGLDRPSSGRVALGGRDLASMSEGELLETRRSAFGFVFQDFGLLPVLTAAENVELPLRLAGVEPRERDRRVEELLAMVGLQRSTAQRPDELSGGQQQRVGIARALALRPRVLLADEPTAQLDSATGAAMTELIVDLVRAQGLAAVVTTHDDAVMERADRVVELHDGRLTEVD